MIQPLELLTYIAMTMILSVAVGAYIGVAMILSNKVYRALAERLGYLSLKPELLCIMFFIAMLSPLVGTMIYLVDLTAAS